MDERGTVARLIDLLKVDHQLRWVMLGVCEHLRTKERDDVVGDDFDGLGREVVVVDPEEGVEPRYFVCDEFARDEALRETEKREKRVLARR